MAILPPTEAFFRFTLDPVEMEKQAQMLDQGMSPDEIASIQSEMELALNKLELSILRSIETSNDRVVVHEALLHLIVSGNAPFTSATTVWFAIRSTVMSCCGIPLVSL